MTPQAKAVQAMGWELITSPLWAGSVCHLGTYQYRAIQGSFCTPWRETQDQVVEDVKLIKAKREEKQE